MGIQASSHWCLVGNIAESRQFGPGGLEERSGTKHFSPKTKVFCLPAQWGDGYERIVAIGRHRGSKVFSRMVIRSEWVTNWRAKVVYHPAVLALLCADGSRNWVSEEEVMLFMKAMNETHSSAVRRPPPI